MDQKILTAALKRIVADVDLKLYDWDGEKIITEDEAADEGIFQIQAHKNGMKAAYVQVYHESGWYVFEVKVDESHRRQGIATKMYDYADEIVGSSVKPQVLDPNVGDPDLTDDALNFWKERAPHLVDDILDAIDTYKKRT